MHQDAVASSVAKTGRFHNWRKIAIYFIIGIERDIVHPNVQNTLLSTSRSRVQLIVALVAIIISLYLLACFIGSFVIVFLRQYIYSALSPFESQISQSQNVLLGKIIFCLLIGTICGVAFGVLTYAFLHRKIMMRTQLVAWLLMTIAGNVLGLLFVALIVPTKNQGFVALLGIYAFGGLIIGAIQWLLLRRVSPNAYLWIIAMTLAWSCLGGILFWFNPADF